MLFLLPQLSYADGCGDMTSITLGMQSSCNVTDNTFQQDFTVNYQVSGASQITFTVTMGDGSEQPFVTTSIGQNATFTLMNLPANGEEQTILSIMMTTDVCPNDSDIVTGNALPTIQAPESCQSSCDADIILTQTSIADGGMFQASNTITTSGDMIVNGTETIFSAPTVTLTAGFIVPAGVSFTATTTPCAPVTTIPTTASKQIANTETIEAIAPINMTVAPNPSSQGTATIYFDYHLETPQTIGVYLFDINGKLVQKLYEQDYQLDGEDRIALKSCNIPNGTYFVGMQSEQEQIVQKIIIQR